jgi:hypothetical protein
VYPFPSFVKEGILCSIVGHALRERERGKDIHRGIKREKNRDSKKGRERKRRK